MTYKECYVGSRLHTQDGDDLDIGQIWQNQSWPIALASRRGHHRKCSYSLVLAGTLELLICSVGMDQKENIDLHSIKTVFHGSKHLKMKMERPSRPTRPSGVIARWFLPCPHSQYMRPFTSAAARRCPWNPPLLYKPHWTQSSIHSYIIEKYWNRAYTEYFMFSF